MKKGNIIVALDGVSANKALRIARLLKGLVWGFKVNDLLFQDFKIIKKLKRYGRVFVDVKLYDIPNTVQNSVTRLSGAGADIITIHASGGIEMMKAAKIVAGKAKIIAVMFLTSFEKISKKNFSNLINDIERAGVDGLVCSAHELKYLKNTKLLKIVPGIRPQWYQKQDDQKRTMAPKAALVAGADFLVIGRPIIESRDFHKSLVRIMDEIKL